MSVTRINEFRAKEGKAEALRTLLTSVIPVIASAAGCMSCNLIQSYDDPTHFVVLEIWESIESHQAAVRNIPAETLAGVTDLLEGRPIGEYYHT